MSFVDAINRFHGIPLGSKGGFLQLSLNWSKPSTKAVVLALCFEMESKSSTTSCRPTALFIRLIFRFTLTWRANLSKVRAFAANFGMGCGRLSTSFPKVTSPKSLPALCDFSDYGKGSGETHARGHSSVSQQSLQWVFDRCHSCLQEHSRCNGFTETRVLSSANHLENPPTFPSAVLPTRVLKLGKEGDTVQLVEPTQGTFESYACLSHCWGNSQRIITTNDTIGQRKAGIAWDMLPKTFQDAITFTRMLGIVSALFRTALETGIARRLRWQPYTGTQLLR